jgi:hypothetical protein
LRIRGESASRAASIPYSHENGCLPLEQERYPLLASRNVLKTLE